MAVARSIGTALGKGIGGYLGGEAGSEGAKAGAAIGGPVGAAVVEGAEKAVEALKKLGDAIFGFVEKSSPGTIAQYNQAVDNLSASLGKMFEPFISSFIPWIDGLNNSMTKLGEDIKPITDALGKLSAAMGELFASVLDVFTGAGPGVQLLADALKEMTTWVYYAIAAVQILSGTSPADRKKTFAAGQSSFAGAEDIGKQFALSALNQRGGEDIQSQMQKDIEKIKDNLKDFFEFAKEFRKGAEQVKQEVNKVLENPIQWAFGG